MPPILSSWKEIAGYVGKSIRTVQRWERESQFPVRRPRNGKGAVLAYTNELDAWVRTQAAVQATTRAASDIEQLRDLAAVLQAENQELLQELQAFRVAKSVNKSNRADRSPLRDIISLAHSNRTRTAELLRRSAEIQDYWQNLCQLLSDKEDGKSILIRRLELIQ
jgi:hypothetical protein